MTQDTSSKPTRQRAKIEELAAKVRQAENLKKGAEIPVPKNLRNGKQGEAKSIAAAEAGEMLAALELKPGPNGDGDTMSLTAFGIERHQSSRWQRIARIPEWEPLVPKWVQLVPS